MADRQQRRNNQKDSNEKLELAKKIASQRQKVTQTYEAMESSLIRILRWISNWVDRLLFNQKYSKVIAVFLALTLYMTVTYAGGSLFDNAIRTTLVLEEVPVSVTVNDVVYEYSGIPDKVKVYVYGDEADLQMVKTQSNYKVVADLTSMTEGRFEVKLLDSGFGNRVSVSVEPSTVVVDIRKKATASYTLGYDFVNTNKMDQMYALGEPILDTTEVTVRASQSVLNNIAFVKALIDVEGVSGEFTKEVPIVAYDANGNRLDVTIVPSIVKVTIPVSSPNKTVPIVIVPNGEIPNGMAIDSYDLDHQSVTLYASDAVLAKIDQLRVNIDATKLTEDAKYYETLVLPNGVRKLSVTRVNMDIKLKPATTKTITVPIQYRGNDKGYLFELVGSESANVTITLTGTESNLRTITAENFGEVYFDMYGIEPGEHELQLIVSGSNPLVKYTLEKTTIRIIVKENNGN